MFGSWPTNDFLSLLPPLQQQFYVDVATLSGPDAAKLANEVIAKTETHNEYYADGGEYLPLSVWTVRGFDADRIARNTHPADIKECPVLGTCYRVKIVSKGNTGSRTLTKSQSLKRKTNDVALQDGGAQSSGILALRDVGPPPIADGDEEDSEPESQSSSSSSTSSSSSSGKKHKKKRQTVKEEQEEVKEGQERQNRQQGQT